MIRWGILGPGRIAHNFADGLAETEAGRLVAIASRSAQTRAAFGDRYAIAEAARHGSYAALAADPEVDAIYVSTPHPWHAEHALLAMRASKAVLVEKPAGLNLTEVTTLTEAATQEGVFFAEALMYRCHPQIARLVALLRDGAIGEVRHMVARFGFAAAFDPASRLFDPALAGGGIYDVGVYPVSLCRLVAGVALGGEVAEPLAVKGAGVIGRTGVDEIAYGLMTFDGSITAEIACALARPMENTLVVHGSAGRIELPDPWTPGRNAGPSDAVIRITVDGVTRDAQIRDPRHLFAHEAERISTAIAQGLKQAPFPAASHADSRGTAAVIDRWRAELVPLAQPALRRIPGTMPKGLPPMPQIRLSGLDRGMSRLVLGCDNRDTLAEAAIVWDAWMEAGGTAFDTAFVYGGGRHETVFGAWLAARGVADAVTVIVKGAHSPYCTPRAIGTQLGISLGRLGLDSAAIYIMHRDNPDVPVGEFVDAITALHEAGRIGIWGGSNWTIERFEAARAHAMANGGLAPAILNNNLSLAVMEEPVWAGCVTGNTPATLDWLRRSGSIHLSWSSQARGYFLPAALRDRLPEDTRPETCFGSAANAERRRRAETLAETRGVSAHNVALAWVLAQSFPSLALVGPRSPGEIASTLPALQVDLTAEEAAWLNLEA